jgi:SAM-dependent methyltransferase
MTSLAAIEPAGRQCPICAAPLGEPTIGAPDRLHGTAGVFRVAVCPSCTAGVTLPPVSDEQLAGFYPDDYGPYDDRMNALERIASRTIRAFQGWNALRTAPLAQLRGRTPGRGLDVGCGRGDLAVLLASRGWVMSGIEPSASACSVAGARGIDARCGTLSTVSLDAGAYAAVIFRHSLEHTSDPINALRTAADALVPGGLMLVSVPNFGSWQARRLRGRWYHLDLPRHRVHFTPAALQRALTAANLTVESMSTSSSAVGLPASLQYRVFGRCLFPGGLALRGASGLCALTLPLTMAFDRAAGAGDTLHAVASRPR